MKFSKNKVYSLLLAALAGSLIPLTSSAANSSYDWDGTKLTGPNDEIISANPTGNYTLNLENKTSTRGYYGVLNISSIYLPDGSRNPNPPPSLEFVGGSFIRNTAETSSWVDGAAVTINLYGTDGGKNGDDWFTVKFIGTDFIRNTNAAKQASRGGAVGIFPEMNFKSQERVIFQNVKFESNKTTGTGSGSGGGALYADGGHLELVEAEFTSNSAKYGDGGAVLLHSHSHDNSPTLYTVSIKNASFKDNMAIEGNGGALAHTYLEGKGQKVTFAISVSGTDFTSNKAYGNGGAVYLASGGEHKFNDVNFSGNSAGANGGAIYLAKHKNLENEPIAVTLNVSKDLSYTGNKAEKGGGFLYLAEGAQAAINTVGEAVLTIGSKGADANTDSIASESKEALLTKTGTGTLLMNGDLNGFSGKADINGGSMHVTSDWLIKNDVSVDGASLILDKANLAESAILANNSTVILNELSGKSLNGTVSIAGLKSAFVFGSSDTKGLQAAADLVGVTSGPSAYIAKTLSIGEAGSLILQKQFDSDDESGDGSDEGDQETGVLIGKGTNLFLNAGATIIGTDKAVFEAEEGSSIYLDNALLGQEYQLTEGFERVVNDANFATTNRLLGASISKDEKGQLVIAVGKSDVKIDSLIPNSVDAVLEGATGEGAVRINALLDVNNGLSDAQVARQLNSIALMGAASGAQTIAINTSDLIQDTLDLHGSLLASYAHEKAGPDLWIDVNGVFSKANDYKAGTEKFGYKSDLSGVTVGADYAFGNGAALGLAASFGKGSVRGQGSGSGIKNDIDYYGVNLYGTWNTPYVNLIGTVGYLQSKNEIKQAGYKGKPDAKSVSLGIRAEKSLSLNEKLTVTPHIGVRYSHVKLDSFTSGGFSYKADKANLVSVPFGVAFNANLTAPCGAKVKPFVDVSIAPNFGDRKVSNKVGLQGVGTLDSFDARIANNAMYRGKIGLEATKGSHSFGLNYGIGGGDLGRVDQALQAKYRYEF